MAVWYLYDGHMKTRISEGTEYVDWKICQKMYTKYHSFMNCTKRWDKESILNVTAGNWLHYFLKAYPSWRDLQKKQYVGFFFFVLVFWKAEGQWKALASIVMENGLIFKQYPVETSVTSIHAWIGWWNTNLLSVGRHY